MGRKKNQVGLNELCWNLTTELQNQVIKTLFEGDDSPYSMEERGFLGLIYSGNGQRRRSLFLHRLVKQEPDWVYNGNNGLSFSPKYFSRALDEASAATPGAGIIIVHSHPFPTKSINYPPKPSTPDLKHEVNLLFYLGKALSKGSPLASGIVTPNGAWRVREYRWNDSSNYHSQLHGDREIRRFTYEDALITRIVSADNLKVVRSRSSKNKKIDIYSHDSTIRLWGEEGQALLSTVRLGIAGLGGLGSILVEFLARLGVGELVLVDFDVVERENMNRLMGAKSSDVGKPKVKYVKRIAREAATSKKFVVVVFRGSAAEKEGLDILLDCDLIMNAADSAFARQVLDHIAYSYEIPVIDGGTILIPHDSVEKTRGKSQVSVAGPGFPCLECSGVYTQEEATLAREDNSIFVQESYIKASNAHEEIQVLRSPSVINYNGLVASIMVQRFLSLVLGFPPERKIGQQRYYVEEGSLNWGPVDKCELSCPKRNWTGLGDSHYTPTGIDMIWQKMRISRKYR